MTTPKGGQEKTAKPSAAAKPHAPRARQVSFEWPETGAFIVSVAGDFNNWDPQAHPLRRGKDGIWRVTMSLKPGRYEYKFVVDGQWRPDPFNPDMVPDSHGGSNSVREVK